MGEKFKNLKAEMGQAIQMINTLKKKSPQKFKDFQKKNTGGGTPDPIADKKFNYKTRQRSRTFGEGKSMAQSLGPENTGHEVEEESQTNKVLPYFKESLLQSQFISSPKNEKPQIRISNAIQELPGQSLLDQSGQVYNSIMIPQTEVEDLDRAGMLQVPVISNKKISASNINSEISWEGNLGAVQNHLLNVLALEKSEGHDTDVEGEEFQEELERKFSIMQAILGKLQEEELSNSKHPDARDMHETALMGTAKRLHQKHKQSSRNLGLFFGHENWSLMMNLMIGFRQGLKM